MGKYQLVRRLATGGMAEVFLAKAAGPRGFEKELVVKRILPHLAEDPQFVEMFLTEAKLAARLNHGNVVQIFDFGEQEDSYFIAMEYVEGLDLRTLARRALQRSTPISYPLIARIVSLACEGLAYAHELTDPQSGAPIGFIHRDISTDNILVSTTGGVKVVDFGIAKAANVGQQTRSGVLKGKLAYMPPEYLLGTPIDLRADIYALGVVLYELVASRKPFTAESEAVLAQLIVHGPPADIRALRAGVPEPLVHVIQRALHKKREARYDSCRHMQTDLERFLFQCGEPVGAHQIAQLVKALSAPEPRAVGRVSRDVSGVGRGAALPASQELSRSQKVLPPIAALIPAPPEPLDAPDKKEAEGPTEPLDRSRLTPVSREDPGLEASLRLVTRSRWRWPLVLAVSALGFLAVAVVVFSREPERSVEDIPSPAVREPLPEAPSSPPPSGDPVVEVPQPAPQAVPEVPQPEPVVSGESASTGTSDLSGQALLRVESNLPGQVWINSTLKGNTPWEGRIKPGRMKLEVSGVMRGKNFNQSRTLQLAANERRAVSFTIRRVKVQPRGKPDDVRILQLDGQQLDSGGWVETYEGWHLVKVQHLPTGKISLVECEARAGQRLCKFVVAAPQPSPPPSAPLPPTVSVVAVPSAAESPPVKSVPGDPALDLKKMRLQQPISRELLEQRVRDMKTWLLDNVQNPQDRLGLIEQLDQSHELLVRSTSAHERMGIAIKLDGIEEQLARRLGRKINTPPKQTPASEGR
ncbi:serine/threonine protein kinase [Hyalangium versicolor]|uniref:serine/threonine protein kinase n=1 Tax=Hyalangium versicolor TaxID=2861190 RepID=UPI001CCB5E27|nr:serine/threonine-protein kinase [Hyalangium versicolor]